MIESAPSPSEPSELLEVGLRAAFGENGGESSVLEVVSRLTGTAPKVLLREEQEPDSPAPVVDASARHALPLPEGRGTYHVLGEIARGGMGAVLKAHDVDLGRDVAMKVLHSEHGANASVLRRFVEEAQLGGQLQHPGIVPVYELGLMADQRPYFTMKLVRGRTLSALLAARRDPAERRRHFLSVFEAICRTVAYAHSRGVIHRDLKPANVMVGAFGEVQVMDWGLAKVLRAGSKGSRRGPDDSSVSELETVRSHSESDGTDSVEGAVIGTPAYMSPEQARGEVEKLDERTDVFALGGMLAETLTGRPVYDSAGGELLVRAARAELGPIREALASCGAARELVALCRECLAPERAERPADAGVVAERLHAHMASLEERAQRAQVEAAEARVRASAERRARRLTVALAGTAIVAVIAVGGGWAWTGKQRAEERREHVARVDAALDEARLALAGERWEGAVSAARRAGSLAGEAEWEEVLVDKAALARDIEASAAEALRAAELDRENGVLLAALQEIRRPEGDAIYPTDWAAVDAAYRGLFAGHGLFPDASLAEAVDSASGRGIPVELAAALDEWSLVRGLAGDVEGAVRLSLCAGEIDGDPDRQHLRRAIRELDRQALSSFAAEPEQLPTATLRLLGQALAAVGEVDQAIAVCRRGLLRAPGEFALHVDLARLLAAEDPPEAVGHYRAALALRPESVEVRHELVLVLDQAFDDEPGVRERMLEMLDSALDLLPGDAHLHLHRGWAYRDMDDLDGAERELRKVIDLDPTSSLGHLGLGNVLNSQDRREEARASCRRAIELAPELAEAHVELAKALRDPGPRLPHTDSWFTLRIASLERALELDPGLVDVLNELGMAHGAAGHLEEAIRYYQRALELDGRDRGALVGLGGAHQARGELEQAVTCYRRAQEVRSVPAEDAVLLNNLGIVYKDRGEFDEAIDCYRRALALDETNAYSHGGLGVVLLQRKAATPGPWDRDAIEEAVEHLQRAVELDPGILPFPSWLGSGLFDLGRFEEARRAYERHLDLHECPAGYGQLAGLHRRVGAFAEAESSARRCLQAAAGSLQPHYLFPGQQTTLALVLNDLGRYEEAIESHRRAIEISSEPLGTASVYPLEEQWVRETEAVSYSRLALFLTTVVDSSYRDAEQAERLARRAVGLCPEVGITWCALGSAQVRLGTLDEALESLALAVERTRDPEHAVYSDLYLTMALHRSGRPEEARQRYELAVTELEEQGYPYPDLHALRAEAAALLGIEEDVAGPSQEGAGD